MTSPLALTVEEIRYAAFHASVPLDELSIGRLKYWLNRTVESRRQSYMSTDRARAEYDPDAWRKAGE